MTKLNGSINALKDGLKKKSKTKPLIEWKLKKKPKSREFFFFFVKRLMWVVDEDDVSMLRMEGKMLVFTLRMKGKKILVKASPG